MARPKKPRVLDGIVLVDNLYPDPARRIGVYRYLQPAGTFKTFRAESVEEANALAADANSNRDYEPVLSKIPRESIAYQIPLYINWRQAQDKRMVGKPSWENRKGALRAFGRHFQDIPLCRLDWMRLKTWWEDLTFYQQKLRHAEFRRLFNWLMGEGMCRHLPHNPFTNNDALARLYPMGQEDKARMRIQSREEFWTLYNAAERYPALQIAMGISLTTFLREADICALRLDEHLEAGLLQKVIGKSRNQRGSLNASRLQWDVGNHQLLKQLLQRARELSLKNYRCPFVLSHMPQVRKTGKTKEHACQVTPRRLIEMFAEIRDESKLYANLPAGRTPPTFHEIRSLADKLATDAGYDLKSIQRAMAHEDDSTTRAYLQEHQLPYESVSVVFTEEMIGGTFQ